MSGAILFHPSVCQNSRKPLYVAIADHIESLIDQHELRHNEKLPPTAELARQFGVTLTTAQQGLARLAERGLIRRAPKRGTFINTSRETRCVAVTFGFHPFEMETRFYAMFLKHLQEELTRQDFTFMLHFGLLHEGFEPALKKLKRDITDGQYACLLAIAHSMEFIAWAREQDAIPCFKQVMPDFGVTAHDGMKEILKRGYRKVAFLSLFDDYNTLVKKREREALKSAYDGMGLPFDESMILYWGTTANGAYEKTKAWLANTPRAEWPDAIFSHHDVMTKGMLIALTELGIRVPQDIALLTHANRGDAFAYPVNLTRLEVDPAKVAADTVEFLRKSLPTAKAGVTKGNCWGNVDWIEGDSLPARHP